MRKYHYDTHFTIAGDTDFFTKAYNNGARFKGFNTIVCSFDINGVSGSLSFQMFKEDLEIGSKYNPLFPLMITSLYLFWIIPRVLVRKALPKSIQNKARVIFGKKRQ